MQMTVVDPANLPVSSLTHHPLVAEDGIAVETLQRHVQNGLRCFKAMTAPMAEKERFQYTHLMAKCWKVNARLGGLTEQNHDRELVAVVMRAVSQAVEFEGSTKGDKDSLLGDGVAEVAGVEAAQAAQPLQIADDVDVRSN